MKKMSLKTFIKTASKEGLLSKGLRHPDLSVLCILEAGYYCARCSMQDLSFSMLEQKRVFDSLFRLFSVGPKISIGSAPSLIIVIIFFRKICIPYRENFSSFEYGGKFKAAASQVLLPRMHRNCHHADV